MAVTNYYTIDGSIIAEATGGVRTDYLTDALGSVTATVDSSGNLLNTYRYKPYGDQLAKTGTAADPKFTWVGSQGYRQTGRKHSDVHVRARHYGSAAGRWTTKDKIVMREDAISQYTYSQCRLVLLTDPSGLAPERPSRPPISIGPLPPDKIDIVKRCQDMRKKGAEGFTDCNSHSGEPWTIICADTCRRFCVIEHEAQHRKQISKCCKQLKKCIDKWKSAPDLQKQYQKVYDEWRNINRKAMECEAHKVSGKCHSNLIRAYCRCSGDSSQPCCQELIEGSINDNQQIRELCGGRGIIDCPSVFARC